MNFISQINTPSPLSESATSWSYAAASGGITNTSDVAIKAAAGAGVRNVIRTLGVINRSATATEVVVKDGSTVIWRMEFGQSEGIQVTFDPPLIGTANTALNVACITTASKTYVNAQGYTI